MAPPLYFFARKQMADVVDAAADRFRDPLLRELGLAEVLGDVTSVRRQTATNELPSRGPGGASGVIVTVLPAGGRDVLRLGYHPDFQSWRLAQGSDPLEAPRRTPAPNHQSPTPELWLGIDNEHPPTPEDLARQEPPAHRGWVMTLADGREWHVPVVRRPPIAAEFAHPITGLPMDLGWDLAGRFCETIKPQYEQLWEDAGAICDFFYDPDGEKREGRFELSVETGLAWCLRILALNYRYGRHEQNLLHAIDKTNVFQVLGLAIDVPLVNRLLAKKKGGSPTGEAANTTRGGPDTCPVTDPAAESCS